MRIKRNEWRLIFEPKQLAISEKGTEKLVHTARTLISDNKYDIDFVFVTVDVRNAFNSYSRPTAFKAIAKYCPEIYRFTVFKYNDHIPLFMSDGSKIYSQSGSKQGDALSNIMYSAFDKFIIDPIRRKYQTLFNMAFCDDRYIAGNSSVVAAFFTETRAALAEVGAVHRPDKCHIFHHPANGNNLHELFDDDLINLHPDYNIAKILGSHIGEDAFIQSNVKKQTDKVITMMDKAADLSDPQRRC